MKSSHIKSLRFNQLLVLAVVCMIVNNFNVVMAIQSNPTNGMPSLVLIDQQSGRTPPNATAVKGYFSDFVKYFGIESSRVDVDVEIVDGLSALVKFLNKPKYSTIIYVLQGQGTKDFGYCGMSAQLKATFNKTVLFWPCPKMKTTTERYLPSYETISYAVKSISMKFNWTDATIFANDEEWGLPLAIAANLHVPYRIEIGAKHLRDVQIVDDVGKVLIITSSINAPETIEILSRMENLTQTRALLIDIIGSVFNNQNDFIHNLNSHKDNINLPASGNHNLFVLTILTDRFKTFLNYSFHDEFEKLFNDVNENGNAADGGDEFFSLIKSIFNRDISNRSDDEIVRDIRKNVRDSCDTCGNSIRAHISYCEDKVKRAQRSSPSDGNIKSMCEEIFREIDVRQTPSLVLDRTRTSLAIQHHYVHPLFGEFFSLFDFIITATMSLPVSDNTNSQYDFIVLDLQMVSSGAANQTTFLWRPFFIVQQNQINKQIFTAHPVMPSYSDWFYHSMNIYWTCGLQCWIITTLALILFLISMVVSIAVGIAVRNYLLRKRLSKGPNKIVLSATDFVFPIDARRVDEGIEAMLCCWLQQLQEFGGPEVEKPDLLKGSIGSLKNLGLANAVANKAGSAASSIVKQKTVLDMRARYNGDLVQLKEIITGPSNELKSKAMDHLVMTHGLRHENINPLIGWLSDPNRNAMVFEHCSRGSLQDVLVMDEIKLDWSFRLSLLTDLVRGMKYLHSSPLRVHGSLSSRNCVVDARWVLKVTDYGLLAFSEAQGIHLPTKTAKELLWTAPEILRNTKGLPKSGTQSADVYSFGIIMQEVVVRGEPYCMLSLTPDEIISKIKKPPPLIRPSVSKGAAPPEAINIMRQCWAEQPDMRPDFNSVYERFKQLNQGRKVNFVDTMFQMLEKYSNNLEELIRERTDQLDMERKKTEQLLNRMLPSSVAEKLKVGLGVEPEEFSDVTIYFSDIVGFTTIAAHCSPVQVVDLLNDLYTCFDATINAYSVYKVETIGDAYMVVSGLPVRSPDHAEQIATMALDLLHQSGSFEIKHLPGVPLQLRIGLHTGPCCAGVVGLTMPRYCLFGDTVNTASRMESTGSSWRIHLSEATRDRLERAGGYYLEPRGPIEIKGKGLMNTYWLLGKMGFDKVLPTPPPIGLDEHLSKTSQIKSQQKATPSVSANQSSSRSSSIAGEMVDVRVEITPPKDSEQSTLPNSYSVDSNATLNLSINLSDFKTPSTSPQQRKYSEIPTEGLLNPANFGRCTPSPSTSGPPNKLYKKLEEMMDLSLPYNHYRCLSPSESNLTQCNDGKYMYSVAKGADLNKPGSSRLLRRQFSLDKDDCLATQLTKSGLEISTLQENHSGPTSSNVKPSGRLIKQHSASVAVDLEKIEEIPVSPTQPTGHGYKNELFLTQIPGSEPGSPHSDNDASTSNGSVAEKREISLNVESLIIR
ncbi:uncharacterized protein LOC119075714 isoform X2 [Bradysia coprophila]|uniref:uncharacterized protein LOC119075714 isoform X2 n=1 Tax=Bradysia coprophila TaxID=38358 RepID=UPI00187DC8E1|nr:uncharacterized protein LOC119075714 isoform X2 [Bradysia coprophila]